MDTDGKYTEVMIKWLDCIRDNKQPAIFGDGTDSMDFVHVKDVAHANVLALQSDVTDEAFNVGDQVETNLKQMLDTLLKVNNADLQPVFKEANSINPVSRRLADISKADKILGYTPAITLEQGLKELSAWYFEKQKQKSKI
jgi:UDP-glucose 4-epimerase